MRWRHAYRPQRFSIEPSISVTKAESADRADLAIDDRKLKLAIERSRFDLAPSRGIEKPGKRCH
jgi:hypothetical protein